jgi:hypothetical protein
LNKVLLGEQVETAGRRGGEVLALANKGVHREQARKSGHHRELEPGFMAGLFFDAFTHGPTGRRKGICLYWNNVLRLWPLQSLANTELDLLTFGQAPAAFHPDGPVVHEDVFFPSRAMNP